LIAFFTSLAFTFLVGGLLLSIVRLIKGPALPDRVVSLDLIGMLSLGIVVVSTIKLSDPVYLDVAVVMGLITFMGTIAYARYLERVEAGQ
jgi:multicomponent Na+:H+ antiporter subunit F